MNDLLGDIRFALRGLRKNPGFTAVAVITLALGLGATTAVFSVVDGVLLSALPYPEPERLLRVWHHNTRNDAPREQVSYETFTELVDAVSGIDAAAGISPAWDFTLRGVGEPEHVEGYWVSASFFELLGVRPVVGRGFTPDEDRQGGESVVLIGHALWQRKFGGTPDVVGRTLDVSGTAATIVGVMPPGFQLFEPVDLWAPLGQNPLVARGRQVRWVDVVARLAPGVALERAVPEVEAFMTGLADAYPEQNAGLRATVEGLYVATVGDVRTALWALLGAVGFVLLIACANIGNLLLARASARQGEFAVRRALGADRRRLVRQLLTESLVISVIGGAAGLALAFWLLEVLRVAGPADLPRLQEIGIDLRVLGAALLAALLAGAACGLAPAFTVAREDLQASLKEGGRVAGAGARLRAGFVVSEIALALVLLVGAGLLLRSFSTLMEVDAGFDAEGVLTLQFSVPGSVPPNERVAFYDRLFEDLEAIPGVVAAGGVTRLPLGSQLSTRLEIRGREVPDGEQPDVEFRRASGGYFDAMRIPILAGRTFDARDRPDVPPVMLVSRTAAERFWPGEDPVGKRVRFWFVGITPDAPWIEIIGVAGDVRHFGLDVAAPPVVYVPFSQGSPPGSPLLAVRTAGDPLTIVGAVRDRIRSRDRSIVIWDEQAMTARVGASVAGRRFNLLLIGLFGAIALALAAVGIYGVMAYGVRRRSREIGIRMALGATGADVVRMVVGRGLRLTAIGLALGLVAAFALTRLIRGLLFGVGPTDPVTLVGTTLLLAIVALLASWIPSRRAVRVNPVEALRHE